MKILLLQPLVPPKVLWGKFEKAEGFVIPIGLLSVASFLKYKGYEVCIMDSQVERLTEDALTIYIRDNDFDVVGLSTFTNTITYSYFTAKLCKQILPKCKIVLGGVHATILPQRTLEECPEADYIVMGEGEYRMEGLLQYLCGQNKELKDIDGLAYRQGQEIILQPPNQVIENLDELPLPDYGMLKIEKYIPHPSQYKMLPNYPIIIQRGCPYFCAFCSAHVVQGRKVRFKSVDRIIAELRMLKERYGARGIYFQDSTFLIKKDYIKELLNRMIEEKMNLAWACNTRVNTVDEEILSLMKKAGCWMIDYGIESGNQKSLDLMKKGVTVGQNARAVQLTRAAHIATICSYILCLPGESYEDALNTINLAIKLKSQMALFFLPIPYPGTELEFICQKYGGLQNNIKWEDYGSLNFSHLAYVNPLIGKERMKELLDLANRKYYANPMIIIRNILSIRSLSNLKKYLSVFRALVRF